MVANGPQKGIDFVQRSLCSSHEVDGPLRVVDGLSKAADLGSQFLRNDQGGRAICRAVDLVPGRQSLEGLAEHRLRLLR